MEKIFKDFIKAYICESTENKTFMKLVILQREKKKSICRNNISTALLDMFYPEI